MRTRAGSSAQAGTGGTGPTTRQRSAAALGARAELIERLIVDAELAGERVPGRDELAQLDSVTLGRLAAGMRELADKRAPGLFGPVGAKGGDA